MRIFLFSVVFALSIPANAHEVRQSVPLQKLSETTLMALVTNSDTFHQKKVLVYGYVKLEAENYSISTSSCRSPAPKQETRVWLQLAPSRREDNVEADTEDFYRALKKYARFHNSCAWITGTYDKTIQSGWGDFVGGIKDISAITKKKS